MLRTRNTLENLFVPKNLSVNIYWFLWNPKISAYKFLAKILKIVFVIYFVKLWSGTSYNRISERINSALHLQNMIVQKQFTLPPSLYRGGGGSPTLFMINKYLVQNTHCLLLFPQPHERQTLECSTALKGWLLT